MKKANEHKLLSPRPEALQYWDAAIAPKELAAFQDLLRDMLRGEGRQGLKFERLKTLNNIVLYSVRINQEARLLLTEQTTHSGERILVAVALTHHYKGWEKNKVCAQKLEAYLQRLGLKPDAFDTLTPEPVSDSEQEMLKASLIDDMPAAATYFAGNFLKLTKDQEKVSEISAPGLLFGMPGTGKTVAGVEILRAYSEQNPKTALFFSSTLAPLVEEVKASWAVQHPEKDVQFVPILQLLGQFCDMSMFADKTPCQLGEFKEYMSNMESAYASALKKTPKKVKKPLLLAIAPGKSPEKAYAFLQVLALYELYVSYENKKPKPKPPTELAEYIIKQCGFGKDNAFTIEKLLSCLHDYRSYLGNKKYYDLGITTLPEYIDTPSSDREQGANPERAVLLDEVQHIPPALLLLLGKIFGRCILGIGDPNQALVAQPMELIWRTVFIQYEEAQLTQSLRCPAPVVRMTQSALALLQAIGGVQIKGLSGYRDVPKLEPNALAPFFSDLPKNYSARESGALHIIVAKRAQIAAAEKTYGKITSLIHCLDDVGGRTFDNVLLVGFWEKTPWKMLTDNDYGNAGAAKAGNMSKTQDERLDIELWLRQFIVAISRCTKNLWLGQLPNNDQAKRFLAYFGVQKPVVSPVHEPKKVPENDTTQVKLALDFESFYKEIEAFLQSPDGIVLAEQSIVREQKKHTLTREQDKKLMQLLNNAKTSFQQAMMLKPKLDRSQATGKSHNNEHAWIEAAFKQLNAADMNNIKAAPVLRELKLTEPTQLHVLQAIASKEKNSTARKLLDLLVKNHAFAIESNVGVRGETLPLWCSLLLNGIWPEEDDKRFDGQFLHKILEKRPGNWTNKMRVVQVIFSSPDDNFIRLLKQLPLRALQQQVVSFCKDTCRLILENNPLGLYHFFMRFGSTTMDFVCLSTFFSTLPLKLELVTKLEQVLPDMQNKSISDAVFSLFKKTKKPSNDVTVAFHASMRYFPIWFRDKQAFDSLQIMMQNLFSQDEQNTILKTAFLTYPDLLLQKHIQDFVFPNLAKYSLDFRLELVEVMRDWRNLVSSLWPLLASWALRYFSEEFAVLIRVPRRDFKDDKSRSAISWLSWVQECLKLHQQLVLDHDTIKALRECVKAIHAVLMGDAFKLDYKRNLLRGFLAPSDKENGLVPIFQLLLPIIAKQQSTSEMNETVLKLGGIFRHFATEILPGQCMMMGLWFSVLRELDKSKYLTPSEQYIFECHFYCQFPDDFWLSFFTSDNIAYTACLPFFSVSFYEKYLPMLCEDNARWEVFMRNEPVVSQVLRTLAAVPTQMLGGLLQCEGLREFVQTIQLQEIKALELLPVEDLLKKYHASQPKSPIWRSVLRIFLSDQYRDTLRDMLDILSTEPSATISPEYTKLAYETWKILLDNLATDIGTPGKTCYVWQKLCDLIPHASSLSERDSRISKALRIRLLMSLWNPADSSGNLHHTFAEYLDSLAQEESAPILQKFEYSDFLNAQIPATSNNANAHLYNRALENLQNKLSPEKIPKQQQPSSSQLSLFEAPRRSQAGVKRGPGMGLN